MRCLGICLVLLVGAEYFACAQLISNNNSPLDFPWMSQHRSFAQSSSSSPDSQNIFSPIAQTDNTGATLPVRSSTPIAAVDKPRGQFDERVSDFIAANVLRFANNFGQLLSQDAPFNKNEVFSPVSIMSALALLMLGAKGKSYQELKTLFGTDYDAELQNNPAKLHGEFGKMLKDIQRHDANEVSRKRKIVNWRNTNTRNSFRNAAATSNNKPIVHIIQVANGLFTQSSYSLNPDYRDVVKSVYRSELAALDFERHGGEARDYINDWVDKKTFSKIPNIVSDEISRDTKVIIASALYFKGFWETPFFGAATVMDSFYPEGIKQPPVQVKMMATGGEYPFYDAKEHNCRIIGLPYRGNLTTMYIIQPNQSSRTVLRELLHTLDEYKIEDMISKMTMKTAVIAFPKLHLMRTINMRDMLMRIGIRDIFNSVSSDLSLIGAGPEPASPSRTTPMSAAPIYQSMNGQPISTPQFSSQPMSTPHFSSQPISTPHFSSQPISTPQFSSQPMSTPHFSPQPMNSQQFNSQPITGLPTKTKLTPITSSNLMDRYREPAYIWSRFGDFDQTPPPSPSLGTPVKPKNRPLAQLEAQRISANYYKSDLYVDDIVHKVDVDVNEQGTEAAAATLTYLRRSGTDVLFRAETPFLVLIRHDPTKLVLFYGIINEPQS